MGHFAKDAADFSGSQFGARVRDIRGRFSPTGRGYGIVSKKKKKKNEGVSNRAAIGKGGKKEEVRACSGKVRVFGDYLRRKGGGKKEKSVKKSSEGLGM